MARIPHATKAGEAGFRPDDMSYVPQIWPSVLLKLRVHQPFTAALGACLTFSVLNASRVFVAPERTRYSRTRASTMSTCKNCAVGSIRVGQRSSARAHTKR